jgi:glycosyltransferase involved in cell wall biosynthesis
LADRHPDYSFVFVGAQKERPEIAAAVRELSRRRNVSFLGAKPSWELAKYPQHFDVCIMPYETNAFTGYIYPLKLHEYLASGVPTVGTGIRSLRDFARDCADVLMLAGSTDEWSSALETALSAHANSPGARARRQAIAKEHDWDVLTWRIARLLVTRLGREDVLACLDRMRTGDTATTELIAEAKVS